MSADNIQTAAEGQLDLDAILTEYRHRQMLEHLIGPIISLIIHVVFIVCAALFMVGKTQLANVSEIEVEIKDLDLKPLDPKIREELEKLEKTVDTPVPTVIRPDVPVDAADIADATVEDAFADMAAADDGASMDLEGALAIGAGETPLKISGLLSGRTAEGRQSMREKYKGSSAAESAVLKALRWLKDHQSPNGSWSRSQPDAMAGLALLAFLAHGETPTSEEFGPTVQKGIQYLVERMMAVTQSPGVGNNSYTNGIVTYSLSEAYSLTKIPFIRPAMEKGLNYIVKGQQKRGGYDYQYAKGERWDLSVGSWQIQAMKAGFVAEADVPGLLEAMDKAVSFVKEITYKDGKFGYSSPGQGSWGMQGAGTLCLQLLGEADSPEARAGVKNITENDQVVWLDNARYSAHSNPAYNWYYQTQAVFHGGMNSFQKWNKQFSQVLVENQHTDGHWECPGKDSDRPEYDSYYSTALNCLSLQVYYRYLPTYKMPKEIVRKPTSVLDDAGGLGLEIR